MELRRLCVPVLMFVSSCLCCQITLAQPAADLGRSTGAPTSVYHGTDLEQIDTSNGNLHINLPLLQLPGRGLDMDIVLSYNSKVFQSVYIPSPDGGAPPPQIIKGYDQNIAAMGSLSGGRGIGSPAWSVGVPRMGFVFTGEADECVATDTNGNCLIDIFHATFLANDGTRVSLVNQPPSGGGPGTGMWSFDGSFALYTSRGLTYKDGVVASYSQSGSTITGESLTDANGNVISCAFSGGNPFFANPTGCTDTLGRHITYGPDPVTGLPGSMTYTDSSGVSRTITFQYAPFTLNYLFTDGTFCNDRGVLSPPSTYLLTSVTLANNLSYSFQYLANADGSTTGEITKITLPTGGYIRYEYGFGPASTDPHLNICTFQGNAQNRMVVNRFVSPDGTAAAEQKWSYALTLLGDNSRVMTVTDPQLNSQIYSRAYGSPLPYQTDYKDAGGKLLKSVRGEVESAPGTSQYLYTSAAFTNARYKSLTTILSDTNQQSKATFTYGTFNNVIERDETDWGTGAPGPIVRKSSFTYWNDSNAAYAGDTVHILDRVKDQTVCDAGSTFCSQSTTSYDTTPLTSTASTPIAQHDYTNFSSANTLRGNPTQVSRYLNTTGGNLVTTNLYNDVGNLLQVTDPKLNVTSFSYTDNYANGAPAQPTSAFFTQITRPVTGGVNHIQRSQYYFNTGLTAATCGENFPSGTACAFGLTGTRPDYQSMTYDRMGRPLVVGQGDGGRTTFTYNELSLPINIGVRTKIDSDSTHDRTETAVYDGLGRLSQTQLTSDPSGTTYQLTTYDSLGRKSQAFNPTRCNPPGTNCGEATWGYTTFGYDGLGRVITVTSQDAGVSTSSFNGNSTTVTDQAGKQRRSISDGLGRLIEVDEPGIAPQQNNHVLMQTDSNLVLYTPDNTALWSTGTAGSGADGYEVQDNGDVVMYVEKWQAGTYVAPSPGPFPSQSCKIGWALNAPQTLSPGQCLVSQLGQYRLGMETDGNLVLYNLVNGVYTVTWNSATYNHPGAYAVMQTDGNFVVYSSGGTVLWASGTSGTLSQRLELWDDGRFIIFRSSWNTGTAQGWWAGSMSHPGCDLGIGTGRGGWMGTGQCFVSPNGRYELLLQSNGNLVLYDRLPNPATALWSTGTAVTPMSPGVAIRTLYSYDGLSNLTCVEQHGNDATGTGCSAPASSDASSTWRVRRFAYDTLSRLTSSSNPESNTATTGTPPHLVRVNTTYAYDPNGSLLQKISPLVNQQGISTQTISYCYDALNRITGKAYSAQTCSNGLLPTGTAVASYSYDQISFNGLTIENGIGRRTGMTDQAGSEAWSYDPMGRSTFDKRTIGSVTKITSYLYNLVGSPTSITYPSGSTITYTYNSAAQAISAIDTANSINYATLATYSPAGLLASLKNGSNLASTFYYNNRLQPCRITVTTGTTNPSNCADPNIVGNIIDFTYGFNLAAGDNGNVISINNNRDTARSQSFAYDLLDRIASVQTGAMTGAKCFGENFGYDAWGNLLTIGGLAQYSGCTQENLGVGANVTNQISTNLYDSAGNMTTGGYTYDADNHLLTAGGVTYTYDGDGKRIQKSSGKLYWFGMGTDVLNETDSTGTTNNSAFNEYVSFSGKRVARRDSSNSVFYYFADHLGTARVMVQSGQTTDCYDADFYPFGGERTPMVNSCPQNYKFTGKERDSESGLDYFGKRYYSNGLGRWTSPDRPFADQHRGDPQSWNIYAYARNNPLRFIDEDGLAVIESKEIKYYTVTGKTAQQAVDQARNHFGKNVAGLTSFRMQVVNPQQKVGAAPKEGGGFTGKAELTKADVKLDQTVELPKWQSSNPAEQAKFDEVVGILQKHEDEHVQINHDEADKLDKSLPGTTGTGEGQTGQEAAQNAYNDMFGKASQKQHDAKADADKKNEDLDKKTNHGTKEPQ
jgi:RHS repeat-associated protein